MTDDTTPISRSRAAKIEGISRQWLDQLVADRRLPTDGRKRVTLRDVRHVRTEGLDPARGRHKALATTPDELTARTAVWTGQLQVVELFAEAIAEDHNRWLEQFGLTRDQATELAVHAILVLALIADELLVNDAAPVKFTSLLTTSPTVDALFAAAERIQPTRKAGAAR